MESCRPIGPLEAVSFMEAVKSARRSKTVNVIIIIRAKPGTILLMQDIKLKTRLTSLAQG